MLIDDVFLEFKNTYNFLYNTYDGINGHCSIFAYYLYSFFIQKGFQPKIFSLNKDVHFWIEVDNYCIDSRRTFKSNDAITKDFQKYIVSTRYTQLSISELCSYIFKRFNLKLTPNCI